jgi:tetratricopeptide (TPR) repeat protein
MRRLLRRLALAAALAALVTPALAEPSAPELEHARKLFAEAQDDQAQQRWQQALTKLDAVAVIKETPGIRFHIANCLEHQGKLVEALESFQRAHALAEDARTRDVLDRVGGRIEQLRIRIPTLTIRLTPSDTDARVRLDDRELDRNLIGTPVGLNPGKHRIVIEFSRLPPVVRDLLLFESRPETIEFVRPEPPAPSTAAPSQLQPATVSAPEKVQGGIGPGPWLTMGAGAALALGGVAAYLQAGSVADDSRDACARNIACDPERAATVRRYDGLALGLWASGAAVVGGGLAWALWPRKKAPTALSVAAQPAGLRLQGAF